MLCREVYRIGHSCETALLRVYNDIVSTIGGGNGATLVLLDLSAAFDTIDHDNLFYIVGICGNSLKLIKSYFSNHTQCVQIDNDKQPLEAISKLNRCLADIRRWMITNKLQINDLKTEFIVFRSQ